MAVPAASTNSLIDVLDRVIDMGVVVDAWVRISLVGIDIVSINASVVVADRSVRLTHDSLDVFLENCPHASRTKRRSDHGASGEDEGSAARPVPLLPRKPVLSGSVAATPPETVQKSEVENPADRPRLPKRGSDLDDWLNQSHRL